MAILDGSVIKKVNITTNRPITRVVKVPIRGNIFGAHLTINEIRGCIMGHGIVDEILSDKSLVRLDLTNYNMDNEAALQAGKTKEQDTKEALEAQKAAAEEEARVKAEAELEAKKAEVEAKKAEEEAKVQAEADAKAKKEAEEKAAAEAKAKEEAVEVEKAEDTKTQSSKPQQQSSKK